MTPCFLLVGDGHPAAGTLRRLLAAGARVGQVFATPGQENRGQLTRLCQDAGIPLEDSILLTGENAADQVQVPVDWIININSTVIIPASVLERAEAGALNMHPGRLPEYAGLHTHQWAIRNGETEFGVTVHEMVPSVDAGDIVEQRIFPISPDETGLSLYLKCMEEGLAALGSVIDRLVSGQLLTRQPQDLSRRRLYRHRDALDGEIRWDRDAAEIERFVRAGSYAPLSSPSFVPTTHLRSGGVVQIDVTRVGDGVTEQQPGTVATTGEGLSVSCGNGSVLEVIRARVGDRVVEGAELQSAIPSGSRLGTAS